VAAVVEKWETLLEDLRSEFQLREDELSLLNEIDKRILESEDTLRGVFAFAARRLRDLLQADHTQMLLRRGRFLETTYSGAGTDIGQLVPMTESLTGLCFIEDRVLNVGDVTEPPFDRLYVPIQGYEQSHLRSLVAAPIRLGDRPIGVISAESSRPYAFRTDHERILYSVAAQVAVALQRLQMFDTAKLFAEVDKLVLEGQQYDTRDELQLALERVITELGLRIKLSGAQILFCQGPDELEIVYSTSPTDVGLRVGIADSICGRAVREKKTIVVGDVSKDPDYRRMLGSAIQSEIAVPIMVGDQHVVLGVLNVESEEPDVFIGFYELVINSFADKVKTLLALTKLRSDVTDTLELRNANDLLVAVGDQTSHMIHRLNNTVGAMRFRIRELQSLQDEGTLRIDDQLRQTLGELFVLAERTLQMPEKMTNLLSQHSKLVDVNQCVRDSVTEVGVPEGVTVEYELGEGIPALELYSFDLVVQNLLRNAVDAMPEGGTLSVSTSLISHPQLTSGYVQLVVRDTGGGMSDDVMSRVFELNYTTKRGKEGMGRGLGLGLWWVRTFVRRAKGDISVKSGLGVGTEFTVKVPFGSPNGGLGTALTGSTLTERGVG
jgi:signal transduction histidine kinase